MEVERRNYITVPVEISNPKDPALRAFQTFLGRLFIKRRLNGLSITPKVEIRSKPGDEGGRRRESYVFINGPKDQVFRCQHDLDSMDLGYHSRGRFNLDGLLVDEMDDLINLATSEVPVSKPIEYVMVEE